MDLGEQVAILNEALREVLADLHGRPLSPSITVAYWLLMTHLLQSQHGLSDEQFASLYPVARALRVTTAPSNPTLN